MRAVLLFLVGLLVGANLVYFGMTRLRPHAACADACPVAATPARAVPSTASARRSSPPAAAGTPVLAVADGHVEKLFTSDAGGLTIYQFDPSGRYAYYYAHLQGYAPGLREKQPVRRGQLLGYVGSTGNASPTAPHLHFAIFLLGPEKQWWKGRAINPYPLLGGR